MNETTNGGMTRREALGTSGRILAASALASLAVPQVHAGEDNTIQVALVGCGGRGTGAVVNALSTKSGPIKLVAMADVFKDKLYGSYEHLKKEHPDQVDVPPERQFVDFDGYKKAIDCLRPGDVVIFATPPAFRWVHFNYAIEKGVNVFMEKPTTVDGPTTKKMFELADKSVEKNLKVG
ncbi:MAG: gfo/Idh/MocA family oxidoreductase, partial [Planctomycetota bacterium]